MTSKHVTQKGPFKCPQCPATYADRRGLGTHLRFAHNVAGTSDAARLYHKRKAAPAEDAATQPVPPSPPPPPPPPVEYIATKDIPGPPFICPECKEDSFTTRPHLGRHRRFVHRIAGRVEAHKMKKTGETEVLPRRKGRPLGVKNKPKPPLALELHASPERTHLTHGSSIDNGNQPHEIHAELDPIAYALAVGSLKEFCRNFAEEHGLPTRIFTRNCAELFYREARR